MKVAILSESSADEAAVEILVRAVLGRPVVRADVPLRTPRGWPAVLHVLPNVIKALHYGTDAEALVVVADSDRTPVYGDVQDPLPPDADRCRLRMLQSKARDVRNRLRPLPGRPLIRVAVGLAVPTVEAWYLCGTDPGVSEQAWLGAVGSRALPYTTGELKRRKYQTDRPSLPVETGQAVANAHRLAGNLGLLEEAFPVGFGSMAAEVRGWLA